jgi:hypothetical protein
MRILNGRSPLAIILLLTCLPAVAGTCSHPVAFINSVERDLTVARNLRADDLDVKVDGKRTRVVSLSLNSGPRRIILMVDSSGSIQPAKKRGWGIALRTAAFAVETVPSNASVAMLTFSERPQRESDGFEEPQQIRRRILDLGKRAPKGGTAILDSIDQALSLFETLQPGDLIYLVSDGGENKSEVSLRKLRGKLVAHGVRVFVFLVPREGIASQEEEAGEAMTEDLAQFTGGLVIRIPWTESERNRQIWMMKSAADIGDQARAMYQMELDISDQAGSVGQLRVLFADRKRDKNTLEYPRQLPSCPPQP